MSTNADELLVVSPNSGWQQESSGVDTDSNQKKKSTSDLTNTQESREMVEVKYNACIIVIGKGGMGSNLNREDKEGIGLI